MLFLNHKRLSFFALIVFLSVIPNPQTQSQEPQNPYIYYFSDVLHSFVIEQPDGSDSRQFAKGVIPESHNSVEGPGWSPSGRWFAFRSLQTTTHSRGDSQSTLISSDGQMVVAFPNQSLTMWSPVEDILLSFDRTESPAQKLVLYDADLKRVIFEHQLIEPVSFSTNIYWKQDGSLISWQTYRDETVVLYNLLLPSFEITETVIERYDGIIYDRNDQFILFTDNNELAIHDIFTHQELRYPFEFNPDASYLSVVWNPAKTEAFISINQYQDQENLIIFWVSLSEERIERVYTDDTGSASCYDCIYWNPSGDRAIIQNRNVTITIVTPTLQRFVLYTPQRFKFWINNHQALFIQSVRVGQTPSASIANTNTGQLEAIDLPANLWWGNRISLFGEYLLIGDHILSIPSFEIIATSQMSAETFSSFMDTHEHSNWVIVGNPSFYPMSGYRSINYEVVELNSTRTRELTTCYAALCSGWLPSQVDPSQFGQASPVSLVPAPIQTILVEKPIQSVMWSEDGTQIHVISAYRDAEESTTSIWNVSTETIVEEYNVPYCQTFLCLFNGKPVSSQGTTFPLINDAETFQVEFDVDIDNFVLRNLQSNEVLHRFGIDSNRLSVEHHYLWVGNILVFPTNPPLDGCFRYWTLQEGLVTDDLPMRCSISPNEDFVLFTYSSLIDKSFLVDTVTGKKTVINFYGQDGAFSPDGTQIVLGTGSELTIWNVADIIAINQ